MTMPRKRRNSKTSVAFRTIARGCTSWLVFVRWEALRRVLLTHYYAARRQQWAAPLPAEIFCQPEPAARLLRRQMFRLADLGELQKALQIFEHPLLLGVRRVAHHEIPERIRNVDTPIADPMFTQQLKCGFAGRVIEASHNDSGVRWEQWLRMGKQKHQLHSIAIFHER